MSTPHTPQIEEDRKLIRRLGGPSKLAKTLGYSKPGSVQRIQNWTVRGIPAAVKVAHPDIFLGSKPVAESV
ncbi:hypothetical protein [Quisquiliibacterium transsilvanicum]|uniref:Helix-turn-helix domain-containing protein n=1 Tax=Quisquiliibacterium transsilvanicum TaxID=1549638 RepID=A0A7W8M8D7_9BURK|nr:hypothetical protein [Quisquiliibacterium transsilvanicum]MBB5271527.1 hypothetical protein [Quisquiliibacterium transsilvanicum]